MNLYCSGHLTTNNDYRTNYDRIFRKPILDIGQKDKTSLGPPQELIEDFKEYIKEDTNEPTK